MLRRSQSNLLNDHHRAKGDLTVVLILISALAVLLLLFIFYPVVLRLELAKTGKEKAAEISLRFVGGLSGMSLLIQDREMLIFLLFLSKKIAPIKLSGRKKVRKEKPEEPVVAEKGARRKLELFITKILNTWVGSSKRLSLARRFRNSVLSFLGSSFSSFRFNRIKCDLDFGTGDPASTGMAFGYVQALDSLGLRGVDLKVRPNYMERKLEGTLILHIYMKLYKLSAAILRLGASLLWIWLGGYLAKLRIGNLLAGGKYRRSG